MPTPPAVANVALFTEQQDFLRPWWWLVLLAGVVPMGVLVVLTCQQPLPLALQLLPLGASLLVLGLFAWLRLDILLDADGISYRMRPLGPRRLAWSEVQRAYVREYSPIGEYGGWGIKGSSFRDYAFNVAGNQGLQLELVDGHRILLGTQRPAELRQALEKLPVAPAA